MARAYEEKAVDALANHLSANMAAKLATIDAALEAPVAYVKAFQPNDNRFPLVQVWDESTEPAEAGQRHSLAVVDCTVAVTNTNTESIEAGELDSRRYLQAIRATIMDDPTLGGLVVQAVWIEASRDLPFVDDYMIRHMRALGVLVEVHDP